MNESVPTPLSPEEKEKRAMFAMVNKVRSKIVVGKPFSQFVGECLQGALKGENVTSVFRACFIANLVTQGLLEEDAYTTVVKNEADVDTYLKDGIFSIPLSEEVLSVDMEALPEGKPRVMRTQVGPLGARKGETKKMDEAVVDEEPNDPIEKRLVGYKQKLKILNAEKDALDKLIEENTFYADAQRAIAELEEVLAKIAQASLISSLMLGEHKTVDSKAIFPSSTESQTGVENVDQEVLEIHRIMFNFLNGGKIPYESITLNPKVSEIVMDIEKKLPDEIYPYLRKVLAYLDLAVSFSDKILPKEKTAKFLAAFHDEYIQSTSVTVERLLTKRDFMKTVFALMEKKLVEGTSFAPSTAFAEALKQRKDEVASVSKIEYTTDAPKGSGVVTIVRPEKGDTN